MASESRAIHRWRRWAFALVPLVGLVELAAHFKQTASVVPERDWLAARDAVKAAAKPDDLVVFAPRWADPLGRMYFGKEIATVEREAFPDESRFPRALEVSIRGQHASELEGWRPVGHQKIGAITITTLENPSPVKLLDDLVAHITADGVRVARVEAAREAECAWSRGGAQAGNLGFGAAIPGDKYTCPGGGFVGVTVNEVLDYRPRRCIFAPPLGGVAVLRLRFVDVAVGRGLHGHHGLYAEAERNRDGAPVTLVFRIGERTVGKVVHQDGEGWKGFELDTSEWAGQKVELVAEITAPNANRRTYCFEADTR